MPTQKVRFFVPSLFASKRANFQQADIHSPTIPTCTMFKPMHTETWVILSQKLIWKFGLQSDNFDVKIGLAGVWNKRKLSFMPKISKKTKLFMMCNSKLESRGFVCSYFFCPKRHHKTFLNFFRYKNIHTQF